MNKELNAIDRFCYKLLIGTIVLLMVVLLDFVNLVSLSSVKKKMNMHWNVLKVVTLFNGDAKLLNVVDLDDTITVSGQAYLQIQNTNNEFIIKTGDYEAVEVYKLGIVVQIKKHNDDSYLVVVKGLDGYEYYYDGLLTVDCSLYQLVKSGQILGKSPKGSNDHFFMLRVYKGGKLVNIFYT